MADLFYSICDFDTPSPNELEISVTDFGTIASVVLDIHLSLCNYIFTYILQYCNRLKQQKIQSLIN